MDKQEPVAWMGVDSFGNVTKFRTNEFGGGVPLFAIPPKKEWVGLTDEEIYDIREGFTYNDEDFNEVGFARVIEAKLKEKNA